jgi:hypothetical protein
MGRHLVRHIISLLLLRQGEGRDEKAKPNLI